MTGYIAKAKKTAVTATMACEESHTQIQKNQRIAKKFTKIFDEADKEMPIIGQKDFKEGHKRIPRNRKRSIKDCTKDYQEDYKEIL